VIWGRAREKVSREQGAWRERCEEGNGGQLAHRKVLQRHAAGGKS